MPSNSSVKNLTVCGCILALICLMWNSAEAAENKGTVRFATLDWTGQQIANGIAAEILRRMNYEVEFVTTTQMPMFQAIADGDIDVSMEQWLNAPRRAFEAYEGKGQLEDLGPLGIIGTDAWVYPSYVESDCPGLPKWRALLNCAEVFRSPDTFPKGRVVDYPVEWNSRTPYWIEAFGLDLVAIPGGSEAAILAEVRSAFTRRAPILFTIWSPHWVFSEFDLKTVEMPEHTESCETDASWGVNPHAPFDCAQANVEIIKIGRPQLATQMPEVYRLLKLYQITNEMQEAMLVRIDLHGEDLDAVVNDWIDSNEIVWQSWVRQSAIH